MYCHETTFRVRYSETDQMGVVYYGHYAQYFEVGRAEAIRSLGMTYKAMEEMGIFMPVIHLDIHYHRPARYDDLLTIKTCLRNLPEKTIQFFGEIYNEHKKLLTSGNVTLAFLYKDTGKTGPAPVGIQNLLKPWFS